jgi:hypothetical protein
MEPMELYALATQMADDLEAAASRRAEAADLFPVLEYLWERGVDLSPALAPRRASRVADGA